MQKVRVEDFPGIDLGDKRRNERFVAIIDNICNQPGSSIPRQNSNWYDAKATYNFFNNKDITQQMLQGAIRAYGTELIKEESVALFIHDMTNINYDSLYQTKDLGYTDHKRVQGLLAHNTIAVSTEGLPLALSGQQVWSRPPKQIGKGKFRKTTAFEDKESYYWYEGIKAVNESVGDHIHKIHIADRQADIYELFFCAYEENTDLLIRAHFNRRLENGSHLWDHLGQKEQQGTLSLQIPDIRSHKKTTIEAQVRFEKVEILRPVRSKDKYERVFLTAIEVRQSGELINEKDRLEWRLLTSMEVSSMEDVYRYIRWYTYRWLIERFHYVLKSGTKIEQLQLKEGTSLKKAVALYSIAAFRIMQMVYQSRITPDVSCEVALSRQQWTSLYLLVNKGKQMVAKKPPTLKEAVAWIGRLGGHLGRKSDGPPGLKTVWLGYQRLCDMVQGYELIKQNLGKG